MSKFTKEFIAEQRKIKPASKLPFEQKWEMVPIKGKNNYLAVFGFHETESWSTGASLAMQDGNYLANAANNYPDALDEIERLNEIIACIKRTLKNDSEKYSWEVAGVNALRLIELNMEGGEDDSK